MSAAIADGSLYRTARRLQRELARAMDAATPERLAVPLMYVDHAHRELTAAWRRLSTARRRGWHLAAERLQEELWPHAQRLQRHVQEVLAVRERPRATVPGIDALMGEVRQLREEFEGLEVDARRRRLVVRTERIVLRDLDLGPFELSLRLDRLSRRDATCFACVALDPHPAGRDAAVTHPHVKDACLCTGEATGPIAAALHEGRITDAFLLVRSVLRTYNPQSPYVHLDEWDGEGRTCPDCGDAVASDHLYYCDDCGREVCDDCMSSCTACEGSCCRACLERDRVADVDCCPACRGTCEDCGRTVASGSMDEGSALCPQCLERTSQTPLPEEDPDHGEGPDSDTTTARTATTAAAAPVGGGTRTADDACGGAERDAAAAA